MTYEVNAAVKHVVHDYVCLVAAGVDTTERYLPFPLNHYAERTFLVYCRGMGQFFSGKGRTTDVYARHFADGFVREVAVWEDWHDHVDKHLMHVTQARIDNKVEWTGKWNAAILRAFRDTWEEFLREVKDDVKSVFAQELQERRASFAAYEF